MMTIYSYGLQVVTMTYLEKIIIHDTAAPSAKALVSQASERGHQGAVVCILLIQIPFLYITNTLSLGAWQSPSVHSLLCSGRETPECLTIYPFQSFPAFIIAHCFRVGVFTVFFSANFC